ncbi:MAG: sigma-70 family RNA polymerase sigma factor [Gemmatimonadota bacterium]
MLPSPDPPSSGAVTRLLLDLRGGDERAVDHLLPLLYEELRILAAQRLRHERPGHTLGATALVHEAYLKLVDQSRVEWQSRAHFLAVASQAMRRILINHAEARQAAKRGGGAAHVPLDEVADLLTEAQVAELVALERALADLERVNPRGAHVVTYRFFGGLTFDEIAEAMGIAPITARRSWDAARAWLRRALREDLPGWAGPVDGAEDGAR